MDERDYIDFSFTKSTDDVDDNKKEETANDNH